MYCSNTFVAHSLRSDTFGFWEVNPASPTASITKQKNRNNVRKELKFKKKE
jgi:hypothetical protein